MRVQPDMDLAAVHHLLRVVGVAMQQPLSDTGKSPLLEPVLYRVVAVL